MKYIGVMTGTSVDGLDVALLEVVESEAPRLLASTTAPLPTALAETLRALAQPGADGLDAVGGADGALGGFVGETVLACMAQWGVPRREVRAIGTHGQTIRHRPRGDHFTVQIGDPNRIAEVTGIDTVADFRRRDMAAGGEGAPLVPLFHAALFRHATRHRMVVNIGGIANLTVLPAGGGAVRGFDTGPGNALLDAWIAARRGERYDCHGAWARRGQVVPGLLDGLLRDPFVSAAPPKSTGKEVYHLGTVEAACRKLTARPKDEDVQASLAEFTARSIAAAIGRWGEQSGDVLLCGGGRRNEYLVARLRNVLAGYRVSATDELGFDGDAVEAAAFAWLAHRRLAGLPGNAPAVTGARGSRVLGAVYLGDGRSASP